jgi:hypothetical protein
MLLTIPQLLLLSRRLLLLLLDSLQPMQDSCANTPRVVAIQPTSTNHLNKLTHNFALNRIALGYRILQSSNLLNLVCKRGLSIVKLGLEINESKGG